MEPPAAPCGSLFACFGIPGFPDRAGGRKVPRPKCELALVAVAMPLHFVNVYLAFVTCEGFIRPGTPEE